jgi:hypothetical protein
VRRVWFGRGMAWALRFAAALPDELDESSVGSVVGLVLQHLGVELGEETDGPELENEKDEADAEGAGGGGGLRTSSEDVIRGRHRRVRSTSY